MLKVSVPLLVISKTQAFEVRFTSRTARSLIASSHAPFVPRAFLADDGLHLEASPSSASLFVNDVPTHTSKRLKPGDEVRFGNIRVLVLPALRVDSVGPRLAAFDVFESRLHDEVIGATPASAVALALVRLPSQNAAARDTAIARIDAQLKAARVTSVWGEFSSDCLAILLRQSTASTLRDLLARLDASTRTVVSAALAPLDATRAPQLLSLAIDGLFGELPAAVEPIALGPLWIRLKDVLERVPPESAVALIGPPGSGRRALARASLAGPLTFVDADLPSNSEAQARGRVVFLSSKALPHVPFNLSLPSLSRRPADVVPLAEAFVAQARLALKKQRLRLSPELHLALENHGWPGEIVELKNVIFRAALVATREDIGFDALPLRFQPETSAAPLASALESTERAVLLQTLARTRWNVTAAAKRLGIPRRTVVYRMAKLQLRRPGRSQM
jgi:Bacterial regulatory protein, Fis family